MKRICPPLITLLLLFLLGCTEKSDPISETTFDPVLKSMSSGSQGNSEGYPWKNHAAPFDFLFGNHFDTHQQSKLVANGEQLQGFFYITFNGKETPEGYPIATHGNCSMNPGCTVGWLLHGVRVEATLEAHEEGQHPTWCIDPDDMPNQPGYTHFHWLGNPSHAHGLNIGDTREGFLLKLTARETFFFKHHGGFLVTPGIDYVTHANVETDCE